MRPLALLLLLTSTALAQIGPDFMKPTTSFPANYKGPVWREGRPLDNTSRGEWWKVFKDEKLNSLMARATAENQQLKAAIARFDQARATTRVARSNFFPTAAANPFITHQGTSSNMPSAFDLMGLRYKGESYDVPVDFSYEIDYLGKVRREVESARAGTAAALAGLHQLHLAIQADLATNYFRIRSLDSEIVILQLAVGGRKEAWNIASARVKAGAGSDLELEQAATEVATAEAGVPALQLQRDELENAIAILVGANAAEFKIKSNALPSDVTPPRVPTGTPSDLLERRPDIAQAERQLAASCAKIGVAKAAFFPSIKLIGNAGYLSGDVATLFEEASLKWNIGPSISIPLFTGGRLRGNLERVRAEYDENLALYRQSILGAFAEIENSLSASRRLAEVQVALAKAIESARKAAGIAKSRYEAGTSPYLDVIEANRTLLATERTRAQLNGQRMIASISLMKALGGGWSQPLSTTVPPSNVDPEAKSVSDEKPSLLGRMKSIFKTAP